MRSILIALFCCAALSASAETIDIYRANSMNRSDVRHVAESAIDIIRRDAGIDIRLRYRRSFRLPRVALVENPMTQYLPRLERLAKRGNRIFLFVPVRYVGLAVAHRGAAFICGRYGVHTLRRAGIPGHPWDLDIFGAAHEFGHLLGASHVEGLTLMNRDPIGVAQKLGWSISVAPQSVEEIGRCLQ